VFLIAGCNSLYEQGGDPISTPANDLPDVFMEDEDSIGQGGNPISTPANDLPEVFVEDEDSSEQGGYQIYKPVSVLAKAFMEDEDIRELFVKVANVSFDLVGSHNASYYSYYPGFYGSWEVEETEAFFYETYGKWVTDYSLRADEETAAAIRRLRELFPGLKDHYQLNIGISTSTEGRFSVEYTLLLRHENFIGIARDSEDLYMEFLFYTPYDLSDVRMYGYTEIDENWHSRFMPIH